MQAIRQVTKTGLPVIGAIGAVLAVLFAAPLLLPTPAHATCQPSCGSPTTTRPPTSRPPGTPGGDAARNAARDAAAQARGGQGGSGQSTGAKNRAEAAALPPNFSSLSPAEQRAALQRSTDALIALDLGNEIMIEFLDAVGRDSKAGGTKNEVELLGEAVQAVIKGQKQEKAVAAAQQGVLPWETAVHKERQVIQARDARNGNRVTTQPLGNAGADRNVTAANVVVAGAEITGNVKTGIKGGVEAIQHGDKQVVVRESSADGRHRSTQTTNLEQGSNSTVVQLDQNGRRIGVTVIVPNPNATGSDVRIYGQDARPATLAIRKQKN